MPSIAQAESIERRMVDKAGKVTKEAYSKIVEKIVKVYEVEKKITAEDAKDIKEKLDNNFEEVKKAIKD